MNVSVYVCVYLCMCMCVNVCVSVSVSCAHVSTDVYSYVYDYIDVYELLMCMYVFCVTTWTDSLSVNLNIAGGSLCNMCCECGNFKCSI